jgi:hypothetical protein
MLALETNFARHALRALLRRHDARRPLLAYVYLTYLYPCNKINLEGGSLLELGDYDAVVRAAQARHGTMLSCDQSCAEGCYMDFSLCIQHPTLLLEESYYRLKSLLRHEIIDSLRSR